MCRGGKDDRILVFGPFFDVDRGLRACYNNVVKRVFTIKLSPRVGVMFGRRSRDGWLSSVCVARRKYDEKSID
jgi:hypothetical protein